MLTKGEYGAIRICIHCLCECKMLPPRWEKKGHFFTKLKNIPTLGPIIFTPKKNGKHTSVKILTQKHS